LVELSLPTKNKRIDLSKVIHSLLEEKQQLDSVILSLETLEKAGGASISANSGQIKMRRGRKFLPPEERRRVSERMKKYWQTRKASQDTGGSNDAKENPAIEADGLPPATKVSVKRGKSNQERGRRAAQGSSE
jgi:hypothetical protein